MARAYAKNRLGRIDALSVPPGSAKPRSRDQEAAGRPGMGLFQDPPRVTPLGYAPPEAAWAATQPPGARTRRVFSSAPFRAPRRHAAATHARCRPDGPG